MKKCLSVFTALTLILLIFASCGKTIKTAYIVPKYTDETYTEFFKDSDGNITSKLEFHYPVFDENLQKDARDTITFIFEQKKKDLIKSMTANADNVRDYMTRFDIDGTEYTIFKFEVAFIDKYAVSIETSQVTDTDPEQVEPATSAFTISCITGKKLSISDLAKDSENGYEDVVKKAIIATANTTYSPNGTLLGADKIQDFNKCYNEENFLYTGSGINFVYSLEELSGGSRVGTYYCYVPFDAIEDVIYTPEQLYSQQ
ncbi:MAG: hypothetical protein MJ121_00190 [Clostridia bacterium]|nr:hypothetical protein [Clostridia bacterium]